MGSIRVSLRALALGALALAGSGCSGPSGNGDDADTASGELASVRWRTLHSGAVGMNMALAPDGSIYVVGYTEQDDADDDLWLGRFDADGVLLWESRTPLSDVGYTHPSALAVDDAGDVYLALLDFLPDSGNDRLRKLDPEGAELWTAMMPGRVYDVAALPGGGAIVAGTQDPLAWAQIVAGDGTLGWSRTFGDPETSSSILTHVALTPDGSGVLLGGRLGLDPGGSRGYVWAATLDVSDGGERWQTALSSEGTVSDRIHGLGIAADGTAIVARTSANHMWVEARDTGGAWLWTWDDHVITGVSTLAVFLDGGFAVGDRVFYDLDHPACSDGSGDCPSATRIERLEPGRTPRWGFTTYECSESYSLLPTADGGLLALARCGETSTQSELGLFQLEP